MFVTDSVLGIDGEYYYVHNHHPAYDVSPLISDWRTHHWGIVSVLDVVPHSSVGIYSCFVADLSQTGNVILKSGERAEFVGTPENWQFVGLDEGHKFICPRYKATVYNLAVEEFHAYAANGVWVHTTIAPPWG